MAKSRTQKATMNIATSAVYEIVAMICAMILPRLILTHYGSAYNGIVTSVVQFLSLIQVLTLGVTASTRVALYKSLADHDIRKTSAIVKATNNYMRKVGLILGIYIVGIALIYPLVVNTGIDYLDVSLLVVIVSMNAFAEFFFGITYRTFLLADQCVYISNVFMTISIILNTAISAVLIELGCSIHVVKLGSAIIFVLRPLLQYIYVHKKYKLIKKIEPDKSALSKRKDAMAHALANIVHDHTDIVVLTIFTDVKIVSVYTVYNLVMNALKKIQMIMTTGTEPIFGNMWVKGQKESIRKFLEFYEYAIYSFSAFVFSVAMVMILPFVALYTRGVTDVEYILPVYAVVISLAFAFQAIRTPYLCLVQGAGHYKETKFAAIIEAAMNMVISVVLVQFIGIVGVAIGTLAANLYRTYQYAFYIDDHLIKRGKRVFILRSLWFLMNMAAIIVPAALVMQYFTLNTWFKWVVAAIAVCVYGFIVMLISSLIFYRRDMVSAVKMGKNIVRRRFGRSSKGRKRPVPAEKTEKTEDDISDIIPDDIPDDISEDIIDGTDLEN